MRKITISTEELKDFLNKANKSTYANKDAPKAEPSRLKSEDYHFESGDLIYHDTYFGAKDFIGEEIVYKNKKPVLGANYFGFILDDGMNKKEIYDFLRQALMQDYESEVPVRGPAEFSSGEWTYTFSISGYLENFSGEEQILFNGRVIYRCLIHGVLFNKMITKKRKMRKTIFIFLIGFVFLLNFIGLTSALSATINVPQKYQEVQAGEQIFF